MSVKKSESWLASNNSRASAMCLSSRRRRWSKSRPLTKCGTKARRRARSGILRLRSTCANSAGAWGGGAFAGRCGVKSENVGDRGKQFSPSPPGEEKKWAIGGMKCCRPSWSIAPLTPALSLGERGERSSQLGIILRRSGLSLTLRAPRVREKIFCAFNGGGVGFVEPIEGGGFADVQ